MHSNNPIMLVSTSAKELEIKMFGMRSSLLCRVIRKFSGLDPGTGRREELICSQDTLVSDLRF